MNEEVREIQKGDNGKIETERDRGRGRERERNKKAERETETEAETEAEIEKYGRSDLEREKMRKCMRGGRARTTTSKWSSLSSSFSSS